MLMDRHHRFIEVAREPGRDDDKERFAQRLKKIAKQKPKDSDKAK